MNGNWTYRLIADTSCDLAPVDNRLRDLSFAPFHISLCGENFLDTDKSRDELLRAMDACEEPARTACPSPAEFLQLFEGEEDVVFVVTISSGLSGTYSSAMTAKSQYEEEHPGRQVHVIDSLSASAGESCVAHHLLDLLARREEGESAETIAERCQAFAREMNTVFVLEDLTNLMKNGRLSKTKGMLASLLNIKPILSTDGAGEIKLMKNARGAKKALRELCNTVAELNRLRVQEKRDVYVSHCNAPDRAEEVADTLRQQGVFASVHILETNGLSTVYASDEGVVVAF